MLRALDPCVPSLTPPGSKFKFRAKGGLALPSTKLTLWCPSASLSCNHQPSLAILDPCSHCPSRLMGRYRHDWWNLSVIYSCRYGSESGKAISGRNMFYFSSSICTWHANSDVSHTWIFYHQDTLNGSLRLHQSCFLRMASHLWSPLWFICFYKVIVCKMCIMLWWKRHCKAELIYKW